MHFILWQIIDGVRGAPRTERAVKGGVAWDALALAVTAGALAGAAIGATIGVLVIIWMTFSPDLKEELGWMSSPFHANMITVIGTLSIFLLGLTASWFFRCKRS